VAASLGEGSFVELVSDSSRMGVSEEEVVERVARFALAFRVVGRTVDIRPGIIEP
jgi:hypothetical protein